MRNCYFCTKEDFFIYRKHITLQSRKVNTQFALPWSVRVLPL